MSSTKKNFTYNLIYQILIIILPLITAPYISRILGTEGIGIYSYTYSVVYYFMLFAMLGLNNYGNRQIARVRDDYKKLAETFTSIYIMQLLISSIMIIAYIIYLTFFVKNNLNIATIQIIYLISTALDINWLFFGLEKFKLTVTRNTIIKLITVLCFFIFVKERTDLYLYTIIMSGSTFISQLSLWPYIKKYTKFVKVRLTDVVKHLKPCLILFIPVISVSLYKIMDKLMLGNMANMEQVGLYENAEKIVNVIVALITALGTVMLPKISNLIANKKYEEGKQYIKKSIDFTMIFSIPIVFGIMAVATTFAPIFFGDEFKASGEILQYLSVTTIFISIANIIRTQYLIPYGKDKSYIISVVIGAIVNIIINILLIPKYNAIGAAIGTVFAEFSVMLYQILAVKNEIDIYNYLKENFKYIILGAIMFGIVILVKDFFSNNLISLFMQVIVGIITYLVGFIFIQMVENKEYNIKNLFHKILKKYGL